MGDPEEWGLNEEAAGLRDEPDDGPFSLVSVGFGTGADELALQPTMARPRKARSLRLARCRFSPPQTEPFDQAPMP
jgi:hypothetical protein